MGAMGVRSVKSLSVLVSEGWGRALWLPLIDIHRVRDSAFSRSFLPALGYRICAFFYSSSSTPYKQISLGKADLSNTE